MNNTMKPYINTELYSSILLLPNQLNNNIYINLKQNLEKILLRKCFRKYGYIMEIYEITKFTSGMIEAENLSASVKFNVSFSCKLCIPLMLQQIVCRIYKINKLLMTAVNGPINVIITSEKINNNNFFIDNNNNIRYRNNNKSLLLSKDDFVKITILRLKINHGDKLIKAIGYLDDMATDEEKKLYFEQIYNKDNDLVNINEYINK